MFKIIVLVFLAAFLTQSTEAKISNLAQLKAVETLAPSTYPWGDWVRLRLMQAAPGAVDPASADDDVYDDEDDEEAEDGSDLDVIEFLKRSAVESDAAPSSKKSKKTKATKAPKLKPWEIAVANKKAAAAASSTTTPAPTVDLAPAPAVGDVSISYAELIKAILAAEDGTTTTPAPSTQEISYEELAQAILAVNKGN